MIIFVESNICSKCLRWTLKICLKKIAIGLDQGFLKKLFTSDMYYIKVNWYLEYDTMNEPELLKSVKYYFCYYYLFMYNRWNNSFLMTIVVKKWLPFQIHLLVLAFGPYLLHCREHLPMAPTYSTIESMPLVRKYGKQDMPMPTLFIMMHLSNSCLHVGTEDDDGNEQLQRT